MTRSLNAVQVAALLVSASYGIGFLLGSGEMTMTHGMGGSIYGLATALGMFLLATFAGRVWRSGLAIWDFFGEAFGDGTKKVVALLSVVWMAGVLAAQIHGGVAITKLLGLSSTLAYSVVLLSIFAASRLNLKTASTVFALFLLASALVLALALIKGNGGDIFLEGPQRFIADVPSIGVGATISIFIAVAALVCTGADYHQFVLAAKRPASAVSGCLLAAVCLAAVSFLPSAVVLGFKESGDLAGLNDPKQIIPYILSREVGHLGAVVSGLFLLGLSGAALGSGAAITRAMTSALSSATAGNKMASPNMLRFVALALAAALASRDQGIIATMVSVNVIYIGSIAIVFMALLVGWKLPTAQAAGAMGAGFFASLSVYMALWGGLKFKDGDLTSLVAGLAASGTVYFCFYFFGGREKSST